MTLDLGTARGVDARAIGKPGERTFQLRLVGETEEAAALWLEKQQLQALSLAFSQVLAQTGGEETAATDLSFFPSPPDAEVHVGRMAVGYDPADKTVVIQAHDLASEEEGDPDILVRLKSVDVAQLSTRLKEMIAGGRPTCPLCSVPLDASGHTCIRSNGHSEQPVPRDRLDDDQAQR